MSNRRNSTRNEDQSHNNCNSYSKEDSTHRRSGIFDNSVRDLEEYYSQKNAEYEAKINGLSKDCKRLRDERNRQRDELSVLKTENEELNKKFNNKLQELKGNNESLCEENVKIKIECEENKKKYIELKDKYNTLGKEVVNYKKQKKDEIHKLQTDLDNEKKNRNSSISQTMNNELREKISKLWKEKNDLSIKLKVEMKKSSETDILKRDINDLNGKCNDLNQRLQIQITTNDKIRNENKSEVLKLKNSFNSQITALKKQRQYFLNCNDMNKRKLLSSQYITVGHEKMYRKNAPKICNSVEKNTTEFVSEVTEKIVHLINNKFKKLKYKNAADIADVVRNNHTESDLIHKSAEKITVKLNDDKVECPECDKSLNGITNLKKHLTLKHLKRLDSYFGSDRIQNRVIDSLDISDD